MKISPCFRRRAAFAGALITLLYSSAFAPAAAITLNNPSFELPDTFDGTFNTEVDGWGETGGAPQRGLHDPLDSSYAGATGNAAPLPGTATGFQFAFVSATDALLAQSAGLLAPNTRYTLTVAFGDPLLGSPLGWIQLVNSQTGDVLAENRDFSGVNGTFVDRSASFTTGGAVAGELIVVLRSAGNETHYDNVRLDGSPVPEPSAGLLLCGGMAALFSRRRRRGGQRAPLLLTALFFAGALHAQVPQILNYQGRVAVNGVNFTGTGAFRFALVNASGNQTFWSNDGTSVAGSQPAAGVSLSVASGLYSVLLGDTALANMTAVPHAVFQNSDVRLRVWFNDGVNGSQLLTPDQRLAPAGNAMVAATVPDAAITAAKIAPASITGDRLASGTLSFDRLQVPAAPGAGNVLAFNGTGLSWITPPTGSGGSGPWLLNGASAYYTGGQVGIGTPTPGTKLTVQTGDLSYGIEHTNGTMRLASFLGADAGWFGTVSNNPLHFFVGNGGASLAIAANANIGIGTQTPTAKLDVRGWLTLESGANPALFTGTGNAELNRHLLLMNSPDFSSASGLKAGGILVSNDFSYANPGKSDLIVKGNVGIGKSTMSAPLDIETNWDPAGIPNVNLTGRKPTVRWEARPGFPFTERIFSWIGHVGTTHGLELWHRDQNISLSSPSDTGWMNRVTFTPEGGINYIGRLSHLDTNETFSSTTRVADFFLGHSQRRGTPGRALVDNGSELVLNFASDWGRTTIGGAVTRVNTLQILGGADLAEPFAMSHAGVEPGSVVVIDAENPGKLRCSAAAYDKKVAGIVSGADGIRPGISMIQEDALEGGENVALSGRVYVKANANGGAIEPGDLLTTSDVPGEAMKANDPKRAQGAILGKAMTPLARAGGKVLVLVTLQ